MEILLSLSTWTITPNYGMIKPSKISCGVLVRVEVRKYQRIRIRGSTGYKSSEPQWRKIGVFEESYVYEFHVGYFTLYSYFLFWRNKSKKQKNKIKKTDYDSMRGNTLIPFTHKACVSHCNMLLQWTTHTILRVKHIPHHRVFGKLFMIRV